MQDIVSPCISVCELDEQSGYCTGCWRTRREIAGWKRMIDEEKRQLLKSLHERREATAPVRARRTNRRRSGSSNQ